jgi:WD40 repeat protein
MEGVVAEALRAKAAQENGEGVEFDLLGPKALDDRVGLGVDWKKYADGGERRLKGHLGEVAAFAECEGRVCSGSLDGSIRVWRMTGEAADEPERRLVPEGPRDEVHSLAAWKGHLISGHASGQLRVWNVVTGACDQVLEGHTRAVLALAVCGSRLASGSHDRSVKVWVMNLKAAAPWVCERTLRGHTDWVRSLAAWQGKVLSGSDDMSIRMWDMGTGAHVATLIGHTSYVLALAVHRDRLFSGSLDGTIRIWALGTWAALQTADHCSQGMWPQPVQCLTVCGSQLVSGSAYIGTQGGLRVWGLESLDLQLTLPLTVGARAQALLSVKGMLWAGVGADVLVRGRTARC